MPSSIHNTSYDASSKVYTVQFKEGGTIYQYQDVPADVASDVEGADSKGSAIAQRIKGSFDVVSVKPEDVDSEGGEV